LGEIFAVSRSYGLYWLCAALEFDRIMFQPREVFSSMSRKTASQVWPGSLLKSGKSSAYFNVVEKNQGQPCADSG
jgi:hypothetical protein